MNFTRERDAADIALLSEIISWIFENRNEFQLVNSAVDHFRPYIYGPDGNYLIGGEAVYNFINDFIKMLWI